MTTVPTCRTRTKTIWTVTASATRAIPTPTATGSTTTTSSRGAARSPRVTHRAMWVAHYPGLPSGVSPSAQSARGEGATRAANPLRSCTNKRARRGALVFCWCCRCAAGAATALRNVTRARAARADGAGRPPTAPPAQQVRPPAPTWSERALRCTRAVTRQSSAAGGSRVSSSSSGVSPVVETWSAGTHTNCSV